MKLPQRLEPLADPRRDGLNQVVGEVQDLQVHEGLQTLNPSDAVAAEVQLPEPRQVGQALHLLDLVEGEVQHLEPPATLQVLNILLWRHWDEISNEYIKHSCQTVNFHKIIVNFLDPTKLLPSCIFFIFSAISYEVLYLGTREL